MKKTILAGLLVIGAVSFAANGTGTLAGNNQPNGVTRMEANNGICSVTGTSTRANSGNFMGKGMKSGNDMMGKNMKMGKKMGRKSQGNGGKYGYALLTPEQRTAAEKNMIAVQEKKLEVRKIMLDKTPDWKKVEKLNLEMATLQAKNRTEMDKARFTARAAALQAQTQPVKAN